MLLAIPALLLAMGGCGDSTSSEITTTVDLGELRLNPTDLEVSNYTTHSLALNRVYPDGRSVSVAGPVTWSSSSSAVASVSQSGEVTARLPGMATITATTSRGSASTQVRILPVNADLRLVIDDSVQVTAGEEGSRPLMARVVDVTGAPVPGVQVDFTVLTDGATMSPARAFTDEDGYAGTTLVPGPMVGAIEAEITSPGIPSAFEVEDGEESPEAIWNLLRRLFQILVNPSFPASVEVTPTSVELLVGERTGLTAEVRDSYGNRITAPTMEWQSSDAAVAAVDAEGYVTARNTGEAQIYVSATDNHGYSADGTAWIAIEENPDASPVFASLAMVAGDGQAGHVENDLDSALEVRALDTTGAPMGAVPITWAVTQGNATLSAASSATDVNGMSRTSVRLGNRVGVVRVRASFEDSFVDFSLSATANPANEDDGDEGGDDGDGGNGGDDGKGGDDSNDGDDGNGGDDEPTAPVAPSQVTDLQVISSTASSITLRFTEVSNGIGGPALYNIRFRAEAEMGNWGTASAVTSGSCASPTNSPLQGIAVGNTRTCTVTGLQAGTAHSFRLAAFRRDGGTAVFSPLSNEVSGSTTGQSSPGGDNTPVSLSLSAPHTSLTSLGEEVQLQVSALNASGNSVNTPSVNWSSSNSNVASVNSSGRVIANAVGTAVISVAAACCATDQVTIEVTQEVASVQVSPSSASLQVGQGQSFQAIARDARGNVVNNVSFAWSTTNASVVSVNGSGAASAVGAGSAQVRASASGQTASSSVSVAGSGSSGPPASGSPFLNDDFSSYSTRAQLLNTNSNPWSAAIQNNAVTPGEFTYLATNPPAGSTNGRAMRYWQEGTGASCAARQPDKGGTMIRSLPSGTRELWTEVRFRLSDNWTLAHPNCGGYNGYKFLFHGLDAGRLDVNIVGSGFEGGYGGPALRPASGVPGGNLQNLVGRWVTVRFHTRLPSPGANNGIYRLWVDGQLVVDAQGWGGNFGDFARLQIGANMNQTVRDDQDIHWDFIRAWTTNPGW